MLLIYFLAGNKGTHSLGGKQYSWRAGGIDPPPPHIWRVEWRMRGRLPLGRLGCC